MLSLRETSGIEGIDATWDQARALHKGILDLYNQIADAGHHGVGYIALISYVQMDEGRITPQAIERAVFATKTHVGPITVHNRRLIPTSLTHQTFTEYAKNRQKPSQ